MDKRPLTGPLGTGPLTGTGPLKARTGPLAAPPATPVQAAAAAVQAALADAIAARPAARIRP